MKSIEQLTRFAIAVYADYCNRGINPEIAREKAVKEVVECNAGVSLVRHSEDSS